MPNKITPEIIEEAINWLESETYCCHALACAMSGEPFESLRTSFIDIKQAEEFLHPLLTRDGISSTGTWENLYSSKTLGFTRKEWLLKIAQELREGKISV